MHNRSTSMTAVLMTAAFILTAGCARGEGPAGVPSADAKAAPAVAANDPGDWPMYNRDVRGHRHNGAERTLNPANVGQLVEKWRFPAEGSGMEIGVIHATPVVV